MIGAVCFVPVLGCRTCVPSVLLSASVGRVFPLHDETGQANYMQIGQRGVKPWLLDDVTEYQYCGDLVYLPAKDGNDEA